MSLQVWLPLNGNLNNLGLNDVVITNYGAVVDTSGKIGSCYKFDGTDDRIQITNLPNPKNVTIAFWMKRGATTNSRQFMFTAWGGVTCEFSTNNTLHCYVNGGNGACDSTMAITVDTGWIHVVYSFEDCIGGKLYINGVLNKSTASSGSISWTTTTGNIGNYSNMYYNGYMNDFRFYDHVLSVKEIEELSKGLVAHYKLDDKYIESTINVCNGSTNGTQASAASPATWGAHKYYTTLENKDYNDPIPNDKKSVMVIDYSTSYGSGGGASVYPPTSFNVEPSTTYIYSRYIKPSDDFTYTHSNFLYRYEYPSGGGTRLIEQGIFNKNNTEYVGDGWYRCWGIFTTQSTTEYLTLPFYTYPGKSITYEISGLQLEKQDHMTPYVASSRNNTIVYDSSGYNYNGIIINPLNISEDTIRYTNSINFDGLTSGILIENLYLSNIINSNITYSFWIKPNGENGARSIYFGSYSSTSWSIEKTSGNLLRLYWNGSPDETCSGVTITDGQWQHICITKNGTSDIKVYLNGDYKWSSTATHNNLNFPTTYRIGRDTRSNDGTPYKGLMSDFRIYCTTFTADQVKELYNTSASVDKAGNIYSREVIE